jgi:hypothetical protein
MPEVQIIAEERFYNEEYQPFMVRPRQPLVDNGHAFVQRQGQDGHRLDPDAHPPPTTHPPLQVYCVSKALSKDVAEAAVDPVRCNMPRAPAFPWRFAVATTFSNPFLAAGGIPARRATSAQGNMRRV